MIELDLDKEKQYVVAFSGGADSALLAYSLKQQCFKFRLVHIVHPDSKASKDGKAIADFCCEWAKKYEVAIKVISITTNSASVKKSGTESAERDARYKALFGELKSDEILLTGHHLDDSIETFFFRLARGTSVKGLSGIQKNSEISPRLMRPLLSIPKSEIQLSVESAAILYGHDSLNDSTELSRGFIRNKIIPLFVEHFSPSKFYASLRRAMENFSECSALLEDLANMDTQICGTNEAGICRVNFANLSDARQRNFIYQLVAKETRLYLSRNAIEEIRKRVKSNSKHMEFTVSGVTVIIDNHSFSLRKNEKDVNMEWMRK
jgi:tRNA(Ile)-lysidine synthase